jgi:hypothetical protein
MWYAAVQSATIDSYCIGWRETMAVQGHVGENIQSMKMLTFKRGFSSVSMLEGSDRLKVHNQPWHSRQILELGSQMLAFKGSRLL